MSNPIPQNAFSKDHAKAYDDRNRALRPISENMHFLIRLVLKDLSEQAHILCLGVGTGAEILSLAKAYPKWTFVGVDPSESMLEVCKQNLKDTGISERATLIHGYVGDVSQGENFDAALSILVGHFIKPEEKLGYYKSMVSLLKSGGYLVNTEISYDLKSLEFPLMIKNWQEVQRLMGANEDSLAALPKLLKENLSVLPHDEVEEILRQSGIEIPVQFFQAFMISGWFGQKTN